MLTNEEQNSTGANGIEKAEYLRRVCAYLIALLGVPLIYYVAAIKGILPEWVKYNQLLSECVLFGLLGGTTYCLRAVYLNRCARNQWNPLWVTWYFLRPIVSTIMGGVTYFVFSIGLVSVGTSGNESTDYFFYVLAFFSGLNVDGFLKKFEGQISKNAGVKQSRQSST